METKYIRLLSYENACKVIEFVNLTQHNYANITHGGIEVEASNWNEIELYIQSLTDRYEINKEDPHTTQQKLVEIAKFWGVIK